MSKFHSKDCALRHNGDWCTCDAIPAPPRESKERDLTANIRLAEQNEILRARLAELEKLMKLRDDDWRGSEYARELNALIYKLDARLAEATRLLKESEWKSYNPDESDWINDGHYCWSCMRIKTDKPEHEGFCALAKFLREE